MLHPFRLNNWYAIVAFNTLSYRATSHYFGETVVFTNGYLLWHFVHHSSLRLSKIMQQCRLGKCWVIVPLFTISQRTTCSQHVSLVSLWKLIRHFDMFLLPFCRFALSLFCRCHFNNTHKHTFVQLGILYTLIHIYSCQSYFRFTWRGFTQFYYRVYCYK